MTETPRTLSDKIWERHVVHSAPGEPDLLYIDLHLVHEVTSPQAFDGLTLAGRGVRRTDLTIATADHNVPTINIDQPIVEPTSAKQVAVLSKNCAEFGVELYPMGHPGTGIVHVIGPEQGLTLPGMTVVCGDSHTSTHGAFGALAFGTGGGVGSIIEFRGSAIRALSMEGRMTVCNMSIEAGARAGMIAPDDTTF